MDDVLRHAPKDVRPYLKRCLEQGWTVRYSGSGHFRIYPADPTKAPITMASTPSDGRSLKNAIAQLKRAGLKM